MSETPREALFDDRYQERLAHIRREVGHANSTRWPEGDSWIRGYAEDCNWLLAQLEATEAALRDLSRELSGE